MANYKNGVYIVTRLMAAFNLKDFQAAGFGGNFIAESGCNPGSVNKAEKAGTFRGSSANGAGYGAGLALWSNSWKTLILKKFNRYTPIETWTLDQQIEIVIKGCGNAYINMIRNTKSVAESTDLVLRGYENGNGGVGGTKLRSKTSMNGYTWAKTVYLADGSKRTFATGYEGLLTSRTSYANKILQMMGSLSLADLSSLGSMIGDSGGYDSGGGSSASLDPANILKLIEQYRNAYPVHSEYETYSGAGGNIFSNALNNAFALASLKDNTLLDSKTNNDKNGKSIHTRIYSTNDATIILDELKIPLDVSNNMTWANKGIDQNAVDKWQKDQDKQKEEAKKKQEETNQNSSTNQNTSTNQNPSTNQNSSTNQKK